MTSQKLLSLLVLLATLAAFVSAQELESIPKNLIIGYREPGDYLIQKEEIKKPARFLSRHIYEKTYVGDNHSIITQVRIVDMSTNGHGATAKVITGGVGRSFISISLKGLYNFGINNVVEIYGKKPIKN
ncbi:probable salivary secreted peptide [Phymastichus coffea]|uniref:probable salivary secreted peptide n=1 Tax=Phymastichus coffea TaxID=108790 RepID=UPI00273BD479|nr:probable salivary secreted peptide [Phymastichus coffea]